MSRPNTIRDISPVFIPDIPDNTPVSVSLLAEPKGLVLGPNLLHIRDLNTVQAMTGMRYEVDGTLATDTYSTISGGSLSSGAEGNRLAIWGYKINEYKYVILITDVKILIRKDDGQYIPLTGNTFTGLYVGDKFSFTPWGDKVIVTNPVIGMYEINLTTMTYANIPTAPQDFQFITVFNGRLVVTGSVSYPARYQWSAQFSSSDWTGLGSGYEDLVAINSKSRNNVIKLIPTTDQRALLVRDSSVDLVVTTDQFDAPFRFSSLHSQITCAAPFAIAKVPAGIIFPTYTDVAVLSEVGVTYIGKQVINQGFSNVFTMDNPNYMWFGSYDPVLMEYHLCRSGVLTLIYQFKFGCWIARIETANTPTICIDFTGGLQSAAYTILGGTYNQLTGTLATLGRLEDSLSSVSYLATTYEEIFNGFNQEGPRQGFIFTTEDVDLVARGRSLYVNGLEVAVKSEDSSIALDILVEYSIDSGVTWNSYQTFMNFGSFDRVTIDKNVTGDRVRFRFTSAPGSNILRKIFFNEINLLCVVGHTERFTT